ncbi:MAG: D-aminoacyl-tRNA deacylase [Firmicutes bacterium]|nr:D-aminoacyl-tRNA deacylase [Bacillota bacterium]
MRALLQRVTHAEVSVDEKCVGSIGKGFLILLGVGQNDTGQQARQLAAKIAGLRVFTDEQDKMNLSLTEVNGGALVVSQFTLYADCRRGRRPNFIPAAPPQIAEPLYEQFCNLLQEEGIGQVERGVFGAEMKVSLCNDGPVTILLDTDELSLPKRH